MSGRRIRKVDVAVIGAGHAGLNAIKEIRKQTSDFVLINGGALGTTCARNGCMPSKAMLEIANLMEQGHRLDRLGLGSDRGRDRADPIVLDELRELRDTFVDLILANSTDELGDELIEGYARLVTPNRILVDDGTRVEAGSIVVAAGGRSQVPEKWASLDDGTVTSESVFELDRLPGSIAVMGLGPIGLELGQALHRLGVEVHGFDQSLRIARISDPEINAESIRIFQREFPIHVGTGIEIRRDGRGFRVSHDQGSVVVEKLLIATGRVPNSIDLGWEKAGIMTDENGLPVFDPGTLQVPDTRIFVAGDATGAPANLQRAAIEGRVAGFNAANARPMTVPSSTPMSIVFSDPNIVEVGRRWDLLDPETTAVARIRFGPVGRAMIMRKNRGLLKLYADRRTGILLGGSMVGPGCEHLAHLLAGFVQQGLTAGEAASMPFYHPVIEEALQDGLWELQRALPSDQTVTAPSDVRTDDRRSNAA